MRLSGEALTLGALGVWMSGLLISGALVAPVVFGSLPDPAEAGAIMEPIFRRLGLVYLAAALALGVGEVLAAWGRGRSGRLWATAARLGLATALGLSALWSAVVVQPEMEALRLTGFTRGVGPHWERFDALHRLSEALAFGQLAAGVALAMLVFAGAWRRAR